jgi:hypothetical protein
VVLHVPAGVEDVGCEGSVDGCSTRVEVVTPNPPPTQNTRHRDFFADFFLSEPPLYRKKKRQQGDSHTLLLTTTSIVVSVRPQTLSGRSFSEHGLRTAGFGWLSNSYILPSRG